MSTPTVTGLPTSPSKPSAGRFAEARDGLQRAIALDGGPATLEARLKARAIAGQIRSRAGLCRGRATSRDGPLDGRADGCDAVGGRSVHRLALLARRRGYWEAAKLLDESPVALEAALPSLGLRPVAALQRDCSTPIAATSTPPSGSIFAPIRFTR